MNRRQQRTEWRARLQQKIAPHKPAAARPAAKSRPVHLRINEIVFQGFPSASAHRIAFDFERELTALLQVRSVPQAWRSGSSIGKAQATPLQVRSLNSAGGVGEQLARAIFALGTGGPKREAKG
jgi:hypothetical protein